MDADLSLEFLRVVEQAAIACAHTMGQGDRHHSDHVAVETMRRVMDSVPIDGTIVIGEGERDEAPMLYIGEKVGLAQSGKAAPGTYPSVDIAVDPLEGTNLCATGAPNAIAVLAASTAGGLLHAPDLYMEKLVVGPSSRDHVSLDAPVHENLKAIARCLGRSVEDLVVIVLDRPRHEQLIADIRRTGARIQLIGDGDLSAGIAAAVVGSGVHAVMGIGGAPEGVLTAAAMRCLNGEIFARLVVRKPEDEARCKAMGTDVKRVYRSADLAPGKRIIFAATGVTAGTLMKGVRFFGDGIRTSSVIMQNEPHQIRFIDSIHVGGTTSDVKIRSSKTRVIRLSVDPQHPDPGAIARLATIIRDGGVIAIPTDTLYGLAADPFNAAAVRRMFAIKRRDAERAVPLVAADIGQVRATFVDLPEAAVRLASRFWPGPLTLLLSAPAGLAPEVTGGLATAGVRVPNHEACRALARVCERPLTATSANISGRDPSADPDEVIRQLGVDLEAILDAGLTAGGLPSTIVDVSGLGDPEESRRRGADGTRHADLRAAPSPTLVRAGAIDWKEIQACLLE